MKFVQLSELLTLTPFFHSSVTFFLRNIFNTRHHRPSNSTRIQDTAIAIAGDKVGGRFPNRRSVRHSQSKCLVYILHINRKRIASIPIFWWQYEMIILASCSQLKKAMTKVNFGMHNYFISFMFKFCHIFCFCFKYRLIKGNRLRRILHNDKRCNRRVSVRGTVFSEPSCNSDMIILLIHFNSSHFSCLNNYFLLHSLLKNSYLFVNFHYRVSVFLSYCKKATQMNNREVVSCERYQKFLHTRNFACSCRKG